MKMILLSVLIIYAGNAMAGGQRIFCRAETKPEILICKDKNGVFLEASAEGPSEELFQWDRSRTLIYTNSERSVFIEFVGTKVFCIDTDGSRLEFLCGTPEFERCP
jgi:hypothetical protein